MIIVLCYKFGFSLEYVLNLTVPQIKILSRNLSKICKNEAGNSDPEPEEDKEVAMKGLINVASMLKEKTGRNSFNINECLQPQQTIDNSKKKKTKEGVICQH